MDLNLKVDRIAAPENIQDLTNIDAAANIMLFANQGRLKIGTWHSSDNKGREVACLLGAMHAGINSSSKCPGKLMPKWLADKVPGMFDQIFDEKNQEDKDAVREIGKQFAIRLARWDGLDDATWEKIRLRFSVNALRALAKKEGFEIAGKFQDLIDATLAGDSDLIKQLKPLAVDEVREKTGYGQLYEMVSSNSKLPSSGCLPGVVWFGIFFDAIDPYLPPLVEQDFNFTAEVMTVEKTPITVRATNIVEARIEALKQAPAGAKLVNDSMAPKAVLAWYNDVPNQLTHNKLGITWTGEYGSHIGKSFRAAYDATVADAKAKGKPFTQSGDTKTAVPNVCAYWGLKVPAPLGA